MNKNTEILCNFLVVPSILVLELDVNKNMFDERRKGFVVFCL